MPFWIVADVNGKRNGLMGPYITESKAEGIKDNLDDGHAEVYETQADSRVEASREIREKRVRKNGLEEGFKNFRHKGVPKEV